MTLKRSPGEAATEERGGVEDDRPLPDSLQKRGSLASIRSGASVASAASPPPLGGDPEFALWSGARGEGDAYTPRAPVLSKPSPALVLASATGEVTSRPNKRDLDRESIV